MGYAKLNIWLRDLNCCPKNVWKVELLVKTCEGQYLVDFNPDIINKLREAYPGYKVDPYTRDDETVIKIMQPDYKEVIKHIEVEVPPGCYIVRAWVCSDNLWSDRAMAIVGCGEEACLNLIVPPANNCIRNVIIPFGIVARDMRLPADKMLIATDMLMATGQIQREAFLRDLDDLTRELKEAKAKDAPKYVEALEETRRLVRGIRVEKK